MTDITDEQRAAVEWLRAVSGHGNGETPEHALALLAALPSELTNPQPVLPTEPGWYQMSDYRTSLARLDIHGRWSWQGNGYTIPDPAQFAPLTRLVPERPQITREQIAAVYDAYPHPSDAALEALLALVNGADQ